MGKILFVTGTDTGVGKTVLTAMLLAFLRERGARALAMKPFCSGPRDDARLLHGLQKEWLTLDEVNPFYFDKPLAPAAARGPKPSLETVLRKIHLVAAKCDLLVVEGVGGLLAPLGRNYVVRDIISRLGCQVIVVCRNQIGVINHVLLTSESLQKAGIEEFMLVMMGVERADLSARTNARMIQQKRPGTPIFCLPYLGLGASKVTFLKKNAKKVKKTLAQVLRHDNLHAFFRRKKEIDQLNLLTIRLRERKVRAD